MKMIDQLTKDFELIGCFGYSQDEINQMESFYDIKISGNLKSFLSEIGRCSGNAQFSVFLIPYTGYYAVKTPKGISGHVATQLEFKRDILKYGRPFLTGNPFLIFVEYETQYYFLRTKADEPLRCLTPEDDYTQLSDDPDIIYHFDSNKKQVINTGQTFMQFLVSKVSKNTIQEVGSGEMINFKK